MHASGPHSALLSFPMIVAAGALGASASAQPLYEIVDLHELIPPAFGAVASTAIGVDANTGLVVGYFEVDCGGVGCIAERAVVWNLCSHTVMIPPVGVNPLYAEGQARGVSGTYVVGYFWDGNQKGTPMVAFRWDTSPSGAFIPLNAESVALDINAQQVIVGNSQGGVYWDPALTLHEILGAEQPACPGVVNEWYEGGVASALGINSSGLAVGQASGSMCTGTGACTGPVGMSTTYKVQTSGDVFTGLCNNCHFDCDPPQVCGIDQFRPCTVSQGYDVNSSGYIVGTADPDFNGDEGDQGFWLAPGAPGESMVLIPRLPGDVGSRALAVRPFGPVIEVVGVSSPQAEQWGGGPSLLGAFNHSNDLHRRAFRYVIPGGPTEDLQSLVVNNAAPFTQLLEAGGISGRGHIVGTGLLDGGEQHAFLLRSLDPCPADLDGDGCVEIQDLLMLLGVPWGSCPAPCPPSCPGDINGDCVVDVQDLLALLAGWGLCP